MAKESTYGTVTPVLTDYARVVDDPGGTPATANATFAAIRTLLQANFTNLTVTNATANSASISSTGYSLTGSDATSMVDLAGTWNTTGTPTAVKLNVTDTASNAASLLMDLQVGGATKIAITKAGNIKGSLSDSYAYTTCNYGWSFGTSLRIRGYIGGTNTALTHGIKTSSLGWIGWDSGGTDQISETSPSVPDVYLSRGAANVLELKRGTNAQTFRVYNTYTDASNGEWMSARFSSNVAEVGSFAAGTGTLRGLRIGVSGNSIGFVGATPVAQQSTTGTTTGFTAGSGTAANDDSTYTGNSGTKAYTVGDIVLALKNYGLLAAS